MNYWYIKDGGKTVLFGDEEDVSRNYPAATKVKDRPADEYIWSIENNDWVIDKEFYIEQRREQYPNFLEIHNAMFKQFIFMIDTGTPMCPEIKDILNIVDIVDKKFPKPE